MLRLNPFYSIKRVVSVVTISILVMVLTIMVESDASSGCILRFDTTHCFSTADSVIIVNNNVTRLDESFRLCYNQAFGKTISPVTVILVLDRSGSMADTDPNDTRTVAAHNFVDSLKRMSPESYVGSLVFSNGVSAKSIYGPVKLSNQSQYDTLWDRIELSARHPQNRLLKTLATTQGIALSTAIDMLVNSTVPGMNQHIIMITDDGWFEFSDIMPEPLLRASRPRFPDNRFPKIHSIVLTGNGNPFVSGVRGLANIQLIADSTGGIYLENETPASIVKNLVNMLFSMGPVSNTVFKEVSIRNNTTNEGHLLNWKSSYKDNVFNVIAQGSGWLLTDSINSFSIKSSWLTDSVLVEDYDTLTIVRSADILNPLGSDHIVIECDTIPVLVKKHVSENDLPAEIISPKDGEVEVSLVSNVSISGSGISHTVNATFGAIIKKYASGGALVSVRSATPLTSVLPGTYGNVTICDSRGSVIARNVPVYQTDITGLYGFIWNGKKNGGIDVGMGTYFAVVNVSDTKGRSYTKSVRIGNQQ